MKNTNNNPNAFQHKRQGKDKHFQQQRIRIFKAFQSNPKTMLMVAIETGILRANICRFIAKWQKVNQIHLVRKGLCNISKHRAGYYSTSKPDTK